ncbi:MAG: DUF4382 domain-containing protein [Archangiaceae bacterium]|nr:DUF4382 domain-containing protein [Archangiaceae bacterium]
MAVSACAGSEPVASSSLGRVQAELNSNTAGVKPLGVKEIIVTIDKVTAHSTSAGWVALSGTDVTVDILKLAQYAQQLGFANVPAGKITQLRLYVKEGGTQYVTRDDGVRVDLKVPSGIQSGIKLKGLFDVSACKAATVPLTFDAKHSIWVHPTGQGDEWILRPVIRTGKVDVADMGCEPTGNPPGSMNPGGMNPGGMNPGGSSDGGVNPGGSSDGGPPLIETPGMGGGVGTPCANNAQCLSGVCVNNVCGVGGPDAPCNAAADCASGVCREGACTPGSAAAPGTPCSSNGQCLSNACVNGACAPGGQGQPCTAASDCLSGYACTAGMCEAPIN